MAMPWEDGATRDARLAMPRSAAIDEKESRAPTDTGPILPRCSSAGPSFPNKWGRFQSAGRKIPFGDAVKTS